MSRTLKALILLTVVGILAFATVANTGASEEPQVVRVTMTDQQVTLSQFVVASGKAVKFVITNKGSIPHQFIVQPYVAAATADTANAPVIAAGTLWTIQHTLSPGIYRVACGLANHAENGMVNALAAEVGHAPTVPVRMDFVIPVLGLVLGSAYILADTLGVRLTWTLSR